MNYLLFGLGVPAMFILISWALYRIFSAFSVSLAIPLAEITSTWMSFLRRGIPVPSDYNEMGSGRFIGEAFLARPEYHAIEIALGKR